MRKSLACHLLISLFLAATLLTGGCEKSNAKDGVLIHITHGTDHPHEVLMALNMAEMMSDTHDVLVYFDIKGVEVVLQGADNLIYSHFPTSKHQLNSLPAKGVALMACPACIKAAGKKSSDLIEGVAVADKARFFSFTQGRILTLDY